MWHKHGQERTHCRSQGREAQHRSTGEHLGFRLETFSASAASADALISRIVYRNMCGRQSRTRCGLFTLQLAQGYKFFVAREVDISALKEECCRTFGAKNCVIAADIENLTVEKNVSRCIVRARAPARVRVPVRALHAFTPKISAHVEMAMVRGTVGGGGR